MVACTRLWRHDSPPRGRSPWKHAGAYYSEVAPRVLIVDPEPFFSETLATALDVDERIRVVGWTTDEQEAERLVSSLAPDVVLTGFDGGPGTVARRIRRMRGHASIVILTRRPVGNMLLEAATAGASGVLGHELGVSELAPLLVDSLDGRFVVEANRLGESLRQAAAARSREGLERDGLERLTDREREVLHLLATGLDNAAIAKRLHLSAHTVRTHVGNILRKLEVHSRAEAARMALSADDPSRAVGVFHIRGPELPRR